MSLRDGLTDRNRKKMEVGQQAAMIKCRKCGRMTQEVGGDITHAAETFAHGCI